MKSCRKGFTLIELILVIVIIAVLAAVSAPIMLRNIKEAKVSEAMPILATIRMAERMYYVENGFYIGVVGIPAWDDGPLSRYIKGADLNGQYFSCNDLNVYVLPDNAHYIIGITNSVMAPRGNEISCSISMNESGGYTKNLN